jgi:hypothetical protein
MARNYSRTGAGLFGGTCGCYILVLLINLTIGSLCLNYCLDTIVGTTISSWLLAGILGLFLGEITIPLAVICFIANLVHVAHPWFPHVVK